MPDARLAVLLLAHVAGGIESGIHKQTWRNPTAARWLHFLTGCGYTLAEIEEQIITAVDQRTNGHDQADEDPADTGTDQDPAGD